MDKNLIYTVDLPGAESRFAMLETIREYALERLTVSSEESAAHKAHAAYCLVLAEEGNPELNAADRDMWLARCDIELDNFRCALDWLFQTSDLDWGLRLSMALFRFWDMREHLAEGRARLETILRLARSAIKLTIRIVLTSLQNRKLSFRKRSPKKLTDRNLRVRFRSEVVVVRTCGLSNGQHRHN